MGGVADSSDYDVVIAVGPDVRSWCWDWPTAVSSEDAMAMLLRGKHAGYEVVAVKDGHLLTRRIFDSSDINIVITVGPDVSSWCWDWLTAMAMRRWQCCYVASMLNMRSWLLRMATAVLMGGVVDSSNCRRHRHEARLESLVLGLAGGQR